MFLSKGYKGIYYLYYTKNGKTTKITTRTKVKSEANKFLKAFNPGNTALYTQKTVIYFEDLQAEILKYTSENFRNSTNSIYKNTFRKFISIIGNKPILSISNRDIEKFKSERVIQVNKVTCNIDLRTLKSIFNLAMKWKLIYENPCAGVKQYKITQKEILCFNATEINLILSNIHDDNLKQVIIFALNTGCRISEIINLEWSDINFTDNYINIRNKECFTTKSGKQRIIPMNETARSLINHLISNKQNIHTLKNDFIFVNTKGIKYNRNEVTMKFKKILRKINLPEKFCFHCLRHTFISNLIKAGCNINYVKEIAGHSSIDTTMNYIHISLNELKEAINKINNVS